MERRGESADERGCAGEAAGRIDTGPRAVREVRRTMPAPLPLTKAQELNEKYGARLSAWGEVIDEFTLRRMLTEIVHAKRHADHLDLAVLNTLEGLVESRRGELESARAAHARAHALLPNEPRIALNLAKALGELERHAEARPLFERVLVMPGLSPVMVLSTLVHLSTCHSHLGDQDSAQEYFERAIASASQTDPEMLILLAQGAALLGRTHDAVEFLARFVAASQNREREDTPALTVLRAAPAELMARVLQVAILARAIHDVEACADAPVPDDMQTPSERVLSPEGWENFVRLVGG
ncbi:MAG: tetratricopeptide repeat protein [Polyangiales bacterium]